METTNIKKFENRTKSAIRLLAFLEAKKGKESELERILISFILQLRKMVILLMFLINH